MKKILITGISGRFGKRLYKSLNFDNFPNTEFLFLSNNVSNLNFYNTDLTIYDNVKKTIENFQPNIILHLAALTLPNSEKDENLSYNINFLITKNLVDVVKKSNLQFIFFSTDKVYGGNIKEPNEDNDLKPKTLYGLHKLKAEKYIIKNLTNYLIFRIPIIHGFGELEDVSVIDKAINNLKAGKEFTLYNNIFRSFVYYKDLINLIISLFLSNDNTLKGTFNIGSKAQSYFDRVLNICKKNNIENQLLKYQSGDVTPIYQGINTKKFLEKFKLNYE